MSGIGIGIGIGVGIGIRESGADSGQPKADSREWEAVGRQQAAIWLIFVKINVYKRGCEKMVIIFSQPFFIYSISW